MIHRGQELHPTCKNYSWHSRTREPSYVARRELSTIAWHEACTSDSGYREKGLAREIFIVTGVIGAGLLLLQQAGCVSSPPSHSTPAALPAVADADGLVSEKDAERLRNSIAARAPDPAEFADVYDTIASLVLNASRSRYDDLLEAGVSIYETQSSFMHAKTAVIDGLWSTVGSSNLDYRSFLHIDEVNAVIFGTEFAGQLEMQFIDDILGSRSIALEDWRDRGVFRRLAEWLSWPVEYWL